VPYYEIDLNAPLAVAFANYGLPWFEVIISVGAFAGLTTTILTLLAAIPRVLMSMGIDGLLPLWFGKINRRTHTPVNATLVSGILATIIALAFELDTLSEIVSVGTLMAFSIVCASVLILRLDPKVNVGDKTETTSENEMDILLKATNTPILTTAKFLMMIYSSGLIATSFVVVYEVHWTAILVLGLITITAFFLLHYIPSKGRVKYPIPHSFLTKEATFSCPLIPTVPLLGIAANVYMAANLPPFAWVVYMAMVGVGVVIYFCYGYRYSKLSSEWGERDSLLWKNDV